MSPAIPLSEFARVATGIETLGGLWSVPRFKAAQQIAAK
jgi:hypothetical protein